MDNKEKNFVSAVIYVHNQAENIGTFLETIINVLENNFENSEIICVNDSSEDNSVEIIRKSNFKATAINISVINMSYFHGLEMAMNAGTGLAIGDFVFEFDSVLLDFGKEDIMNVYKKSLEGFDIVSASPDKKQKLTSKVFYSILSRFSEIPGKINTESFRILSRRVINRISSMNKSIPYRKAIYANCGLKTSNIVYHVKTDNLFINDKAEKRYKKRLAVDTLILFTNVGYKFSITMAGLMMFVALFMVVYSILTYWIRNPVEGWTTIILFLSFTFLGLFGVLAIIIKYLQLIVDLVFKRKHYSFESIEKITIK